MMTLNTNCATCTQQPKCQINIDLRRVAATQPFNKLDNEVSICCSLYRSSGVVYTGSCSTSTVDLGTPFPVESCIAECGFVNRCMDRCDSSDYFDFVAEMKEIAPELSFTNICRCKMPLEDK